MPEQDSASGKDIPIDEDDLTIDSAAEEARDRLADAQGAANGDREAPEASPMVSPAQFPPPSVELTYPAAVIQMQAGQYRGSDSVVMSVVAPDEDGVVRTRHYPMSPKYSETLEKQLREARGVPAIEVVGADQAPRDLRG